MNFDSIKVLMYGTSHEVAKEAERIVNICYTEGDDIFNTGEMNLRDVPVENMKAIIKVARETSKNI